MNVQKNVEQYFAMVTELEKLLPVSANRQEWQSQRNEADALLTSIPSAIRNIQDLLLHAAAKIDTLHEQVSSARDQHLDRLRLVGLLPRNGYWASTHNIFLSSGLSDRGQNA